mmetsp:Transcript_7602/g.34442  ORF Transcript_7602/g.34442 Transcript_7602/m.34442 type:complete len:307 (+) Transcript_7602:2696-3616(+)
MVALRPGACQSGLCGSPPFTDACSLAGPLSSASTCDFSDATSASSCSCLVCGLAWAARAPRLRLTDVCVEIPSRTRSAFRCADAARSKSRSMRRKRSSWSTTAASASSASARRRSRSLRSRFLAFLRSALASSSSSSSRFSSMDGALSSSGSVLTTLPSAAFVDTPSSSSAWRVSSVSANVTSRVSRGLAWDLPAFLALYRVNASSTGPFFGLRFFFTPESSDNSSSSPSPSPSFSPIARAASAAECANAAAAAASAAWRAARSSKSAFRESDTAPDPSANSSRPRLNGSPSNSAIHGASAAMAAL